MYQITKTKRKNACERLTSKPCKDFRVVGTFCLLLMEMGSVYFFKRVFDVCEIAISFRIGRIDSIDSIPKLYVCLDFEIDLDCTLLHMMHMECDAIDGCG